MGAIGDRRRISRTGNNDSAVCAHRELSPKLEGYEDRIEKRTLGTTGERRANNKRVKTLVDHLYADGLETILTVALPAHCPPPRMAGTDTHYNRGGLEEDRGNTGTCGGRSTKRCRRPRVVVVNVDVPPPPNATVASFPLRPVRPGRRTTTRSTAAVMVPDALAGCRWARRRIDTRRHPHAGGLVSGHGPHASYRPRGDSSNHNPAGSKRVPLKVSRRVRVCVFALARARGTSDNTHGTTTRTTTRVTQD